MGQAIGDLLPSAIGVALSPMPVIAVILILGTPRAGVNGPAFAIGWVVSLAVLGAVVIVLSSGADDPDSGPSTTASVVKVVLGAMLVVLAGRQWRRHPRDGAPSEMPRWMQTIDGFTPAKALAFGAALAAANPKNFALTVAAGAAIAQAGVRGGAATVSVALFVVLASLSVVGPVLFSLVVGERATAPLSTIKQFLAANNAVIMMVVLLVLGAKLVGNGIEGLATG